MPASPGDGHVDQFAVPDDIDGDVLDEDAQQLLAAGLRGRRGVPDCRKVAGQGLDRCPLSRGEGRGLFLGEPLVVRFQPGRLGEGGLPAGFQLPGDEPVLRLGQLVLAAGPVGGVAGAPGAAATACPAWPARLRPGRRRPWRPPARPALPRPGPGPRRSHRSRRRRCAGTGRRSRSWSGRTRRYSRRRARAETSW